MQTSAFSNKAGITDFEYGDVGEAGEEGWELKPFLQNTTSGDTTIIQS